jgi:peptidylprolyl isomerase
MASVKQGDIVAVHYTGKLADGTIFDTSYSRAPLQMKVGEGKLIAGFEKALVGMNAGEKKTVVIPSAEAYGQRQDKAVVEMERKNLPPGYEPKVGQRIELEQEDNKTFLVTVTAVTDNTITVDANHPLAGKDLTFEIELVSVQGF